MQTLTPIKAWLPFYIILPFVILIEGFASIGVEILTIRQLLPVAGGSIIVTSLIIGVFLLFLAFGYQQGGQTKLHPKIILQRNFLIASIWIGIGLSYAFIAFFFYIIQKYFGFHIVYPLITYLLFIIAPLIYLLGQTVPIAMNMVKQNQAAGAIGGNTLSLSTIGSFLGATLTTLVLMHYLGVAWTIQIIACLLLMLAIMLAPNFKNLLKCTALAFLIGSIVYLFNLKLENKFFLLTNNYGNYQILNEKNSPLKQGEKLLVINEAFSSYINNDKKGFPYVETIKKLLFHDLNLRHAHILVLGAGGFSMSAENTFDNNFTYIDIDDQIKKIVYPRFIDKLNNKLIIDDARHYIRSSKNQYDVIILDAYSNIKSIPSHLITYEYMLEVKNRLARNGMVIFNMIANPFLNDPYSRRVDNTIRSVFHHCMVIPVHYVNHAMNILYVCQNGKNKNDRTVYSDNLNRSTTDSFNW